jgi:hypothetical protein
MAIHLQRAIFDERNILAPHYRTTPKGMKETIVKNIARSAKFCGPQVLEGGIINF